MSTNAALFLKNNSRGERVSTDRASNLHHAYLVVGNTTSALGAIYDLLGDLKVERHGNPDVHELTMGTFSIDDARTLKASHFIKPMSGHAFFIISLDAITWEAQQSLLKVFEEPVAGTHFFVIAPRLDGFLSTLLSRFVVINLEHAAAQTVAVEKFLASAPAVRLKLIADMVEEKDKQAAINFLNEIQTFTAMLVKSGRMADAQALSESLRLSQFLHTRSPSVKMILEHIALTFPVVST